MGNNNDEVGAGCSNGVSLGTQGDSGGNVASGSPVTSFSGFSAVTVYTFNPGQENGVWPALAPPAPLMLRAPARDRAPDGLLSAAVLSAMPAGASPVCRP